MDNNQGGGNKKVYVAIIALLLLINGIALYLLYSENKAKKDLGEQKVALQNDFINLSDTLDAKKAELEQYKGKNAELDSTITAEQAEIDNQKKTISSLLAKGKMTKDELAKAKSMLAQYEASISDMKKQIEQLATEKQQLTAQNQQLSTDLSTEKQTSNQLSEQNKGLSKKVEIGSLLQLKNVAVTGVRKKSNDKESVVTRIKQLENLRISFETGDNKLLDAGNVSLFLRILNPRGETISVADQGSGNFALAESGASTQYTKKADFEWNQTNKKVDIYWSQNIKEAGTYKVEIYQSGYLVGKGEANFK